MSACGIGVATLAIGDGDGEYHPGRCSRRRGRRFARFWTVRCGRAHGRQDRTEALPPALDFDGVHVADSTLSSVHGVRAQEDVRDAEFNSTASRAHVVSYGFTH